MTLLHVFVASLGILHELLLVDLDQCFLIEHLRLPKTLTDLAVCRVDCHMVPPTSWR